MKLIDREQKPTERLHGLINPDARKQTIGEIVRDLYPKLMESWDNDEAGMSDRDVVAFFRKETGMGNDSANKMKMFFKYLVSEADLGDAAPAAPKATAASATPSAPAATAAPAPAATPPRSERSAAPTRRGQQRQSNDGATSVDRGPSGSRTLSEAQRAYLDTLKSVLRVNIDGDWDDDMIRLAFDRLERLFDRVRRG